MTIYLLWAHASIGLKLHSKNCGQPIAIFGHVQIIRVLATDYQKEYVLKRKKKNSDINQQA